MSTPQMFQSTSPVDKAANHIYNTRSKMDIAQEAIFLGHFKEIAKQEEEVVKRYRNKTLFGDDTMPTPEDEDSLGGGNIIIAEDVQINKAPEAKKSSALQNMALAAIGGGALAGGLALYSAATEKTPEPVVTPVVDTDTNTQYYIKAMAGE